MPRNAKPHIARSLIKAYVFLSLSVPISASADSFAYMGTGSSDFGVIDLTTGVYHECGSTSAVLSGLGVGPDHALYGGAFNQSGFYRIDLTNGSLTQVGVSNIAFSLTGSTPSGVYALDTNDNLYKINITTGMGTLVGATGASIAGSGVWGMSTNSNSLFATSNSSLYKLSLKNGKAKLVGTATNGAFGAEVTENGKLFAGSESPLSVFTLNPSTGAATLLSNVTGNGGDSFWGLAPIKTRSISKGHFCDAHPL